MRLEDERESQNIEDRRGGGFGGGFGGRGGIPIVVGGGGLGTVAIIVIALLLGVDPSFLFQGNEPEPQQQQTQQSRPGGKFAPAENGSEDAQRRFVGRVLATTEDAWTSIFQQRGREYVPPKLVLFSGGTQSACGLAQTAIGPFYCPRDHEVYLDTSFFQEMERKLNAPGDFARAYVIAHEVGHHVQNLLGIIPRVDQARRNMDERQSNALSVRLELQADCFAGIWANVTEKQRHFLEPGDIEAGLNAAAAVGDDRLQRQARGYVEPDSFTHGSSAQRVRWFTQGFRTGDIRQCDTFNADRL